MLGNYITIDGVSSRTLGLFCKQLPMFPIAMQSFNNVTVGGRPDNLYQATGHYNDIIVDIEAVLVGLNTDSVIEWAANGEQLVLSNQPTRYVDIKQLMSVEQKRTGNGALEFKLSFRCGPFKHGLGRERIIVTTSPAYFQTVGNIYSEPLIVAQGCSDGFSMTLNGVSFATTGLTGDIYIDVPNRVVYQIVNGVKTAVQEHTVGNIWDLILIPSTTEYNSLTYSGATSIEIKENERWL